MDLKTKLERLNYDASLSTDERKSLAVEAANEMATLLDSARKAGALDFKVSTYLEVEAADATLKYQIGEPVSVSISPEAV